jgi:acetate kinase
MAAALRGLDALVFTGGVGERSAAVRGGICDRLGFLGVELDRPANERAEPDVEIQAAGVRIVVLRAREDVVAARETRRVLARNMTQTSSRTPVS